VGPLAGWFRATFQSSQIILLAQMWEPGAARQMTEPIRTDLWRSYWSEPPKPIRNLVS